MRWRNVTRVCPVLDKRCVRQCERICRNHCSGKAAPIERVSYWPHGRYNGDPIVGFEIKLILDLGQLRISRYLLPKAYWNLGTRCVIWLCFQIRFDARYGW